MSARGRDLARDARASAEVDFASRCLARMGHARRRRRAAVAMAATAAAMLAGFAMWMPSTPPARGIDAADLAAALLLAALAGLAWIRS